MALLMELDGSGATIPTAGKIPGTKNQGVRPSRSTKRVVVRYRVGEIPEHAATHISQGGRERINCHVRDKG
jgi:LEA14-like dessication related protein